MTWGTPQDFFDYLDRLFHFDIDVCATERTAKCAKYYTPEIDALKQEWLGTCFMNPPYGTEIKHWIKYAYEQSQKQGTRVVALVPARTDTRYWHDYVMKAEWIMFVKGRLKFDDGSGVFNSAPFPSAVIVFNGEHFDPRIDAIDAKIKD